MNEQASSSNQAEMTPASEDTPFLVAFFTFMTNDEIDKALGIDDDSDDDSDDETTGPEVHMMYIDEEEEDDDDWWEWGPIPMPTANLNHMDETDDEYPTVDGNQSALKTTELTEDDEVTEGMTNTSENKNLKQI